MADAAIDCAIEEALSRQEELVLVSVLDPSAASKVVDRFLETGHVGTRPSSDVSRSLRARQEQSSLVQADEISARANARTVSIRRDLRRGELVAEISRAVEQWRPSVVVVEKKPRRLLGLGSSHVFLHELGRRLHFRLVEV